MKYLSLFSGIGGFELGIQQAYEDFKSSRKQQQDKETDGSSNSWITKSDKSEQSSFWRDITCIGYSEIDKYAIQVYNKHFNHKNYGDITKINEKELPDFDLLVGGFPCQSFSIAGLRHGFNDTRGTLFFEIARIIREKQPRYLLLENVKGLLSHDKGNTFFTIISTLDELGYDCQWQVLNSKNFGVPQNRERVFIIGHLRGTPRPEVFPFGETNEKTIKQLNQPKHSNDRIFSKEGLSPTLNTMQGGNRQPFVKVPEATKKGYAVALEGDSINLSVPNSKTRRGRVGKGVAQTLDTGMQQHTLQQGSIRRLTPKECERLQGFPDDWTKNGVDNDFKKKTVKNVNGDIVTVYNDKVKISDSQRYKMCGNAVTVNVIKAIIQKLIF